MSVTELIIMAFGLAMDAFAVSICKGLSMQKRSIKNAMIVGAYFGGFQAGMPAIGYLVGIQFKSYIIAVDHWIAFVLLALIGGKMIWESRDGECPAGDFSFKSMLPLAVATSIDALAVGVTLAFLEVNILLAVVLIGVITFAVSFIGTDVGRTFGEKFKSKAELFGGIVLILIGTKILLEHLGMIQ